MGLCKRRQPAIDDDIQILAVNLQTLPYQFNGLGILSIIVWMLDLLIFTAIVVTFGVRIALFPSSTVAHFEEEPEQTDYISTVSISISTLIEMTALVLGKDWYGWGNAIMVLWYCDVAISLVAAFLPYWIMIRMEKVSVENLPPTALYPATGGQVAYSMVAIANVYVLAILSSASAGSVVLSYCAISVRASLPVLLISYTLLGLGFLIALAILANYTGRLLSASTPPPKKAMAAFIPIASIANAAYSVTSLVSLASCIAEFMYIFSLNLEILLSGATGWSVKESLFSVRSRLRGNGWGRTGRICVRGSRCPRSDWLRNVVDAARDDYCDCRYPKSALFDELRTPGGIAAEGHTLIHRIFVQWSALYPWGVYALALGQLAIDFDSPAFRVLNTIVTCLLLLFWLFCVTMTVPRLVSGQFFLEDAEETRDGREEWSQRKRVRTHKKQQSQDVETGDTARHASEESRHSSNAESQ